MGVPVACALSQEALPHGTSREIQPRDSDGENLRFQGGADEKDGKLHFNGTVNTQDEANKIWDAIKTVPSWQQEVVADILRHRRGSAGRDHRWTERKTYTVKSGDTLSKISKEMLGDANAYMDIFNANKDQLSDPNKIKPRQVLKIPSPAHK